MRARPAPHDERRLVESGESEGAGVSSSSSPQISSTAAVLARRAARENLRREDGEVRFEEEEGEGEEGEGRRMERLGLVPGVEIEVAP